jgi:hypothetical protein
MNALHELRDSLDTALQGAVPDDLRAKGWRYQDFNTRFTPQAWSYLLRLMGEGEYQVIVMSQGKSNSGPWVRGQFFISPQGYLNMQDKSRREATPFETV